MVEESWKGERALVEEQGKRKKRERGGEMALGEEIGEAGERRGEKEKKRAGVGFWVFCFGARPRFTAAGPWPHIFLLYTFKKYHLALLNLSA